MSVLTNKNVRFDYAGLFRCEGEWIHPRRCERTYEIIYVTKGEVYIKEGEREYALLPGQLLLLAPDVEHEGTRISHDVGFYWVHFLVQGGELPFTRRLFDGIESPSLFKELLHFNNLPVVNTELVNAILLHILAELSYRAERFERVFSDRAERIYEWMRINASAELSVKDVAAHFGYSADHVSRLCKSDFGVGALELINRFLCKRAKELLCNTDLYVKEIAARLGFPNDKAFIAFFKYHERCFPSEFRNRFSRLHMNSR